MEAMTHATIEQLEHAWSDLQALVPMAAIRTEPQYDQALETLNRLLDTVGDDETHPLYDLLDTLGVLIHTYEESQSPAGAVSGIDVLRLLMDEHQLTTADLPELGTPVQVADLLAGRQALNVAQIHTLAKRFGVAAATFV
jgi:HTH-type transcriptional regulator / antitoxin HigA